MNWDGRRWFEVVLVAVVLASLPDAAEASGFLVSKIGGDTAGVTEDSPSAVYWNPGAVGLLEGTQLYVDSNLIYRHQSYRRNTQPVRDEGRTYEREELRTLDVQPMLAATTDLGPDWITFGLGVYAPFGSGSSWEADGAQRWQTIFGSILSGYVTPTVSVTPVEGLHVGASASYIRAAVTSYRAFDFGPSVEEQAGRDVPPEHPGHEGRALLDFDGGAWGWAAGVVWEIGRFRLGASYSSKVDIGIPGDVEIHPPRNDFYETFFGDAVKSSGTLYTTWPRIARGGVSWLASDLWKFRLSGEWVQWDLYDRLRIEIDEDVTGTGQTTQEQITDWRNTLNVRAGARHYVPRSSWVVFFGGGVENSAIPEEHLGPELYDAWKLGLAAGGSWKPIDRMRLRFGYTHLLYRSREIESTERTPPPTGSMGQTAGLFNTNLTYRF